jgi:hypothetical protein
MDLPSWSYNHMNWIDTIPNTLTCEFLLSCVRAANGIVLEFARLDVGRRFSESATNRKPNSETRWISNGIRPSDLGSGGGAREPKTRTLADISVLIASSVSDSAEIGSIKPQK